MAFFQTFLPILFEKSDFFAYMRIVFEKSFSVVIAVQCNGNSKVNPAKRKILPRALQCY